MTPSAPVVRPSGGDGLTPLSFFQQVTSTSTHTNVLRNTTFVDDTRQLDNEIDFAGLEGLEGVKVDNDKPQRLFRLSCCSMCECCTGPEHNPFTASCRIGTTCLTGRTLDGTAVDAVHCESPGRQYGNASNESSTSVCALNGYFQYWRYTFLHLVQRSLFFNSGPQNKLWFCLKIWRSLSIW